MTRERRIASSPGKVQRGKAPAEKTDHQEEARTEQENEPLREGRPVKEEKFEIQHGTKDQEGQFGSHRKGGQGRGNEGIRRAADRKDRGKCHQGGDGERGIGRKGKDDLLIDGRAEERCGGGTDDKVDEDIEKITGGNRRDIAETVYETAGLGMMMRMIRATPMGSEKPGTQDRERGEKTNHPSGKDGNREAQAKTKERHLDRTLTAKGRQCAQNHQRIHDRGRQHIGDTAGNREPLAEKAAHHGNNAALADGKDHPEKAAYQNGRAGITGQKTRHERLREILLENPREDRSTKQEGNPLKQDAQEGILEIRQAELKPIG